MASKLRRIRKYQWNSWKRLRKHGFRKRMQTGGWVRVLKRRRNKWRHVLTAQRPKKKSVRG